MFQNTQDLYEFFDAFQNVTYKKKKLYIVYLQQNEFDEFSS